MGHLIFSYLILVSNYEMQFLIFNFYLNLNFNYYNPLFPLLLK